MQRNGENKWQPDLQIATVDVSIRVQKGRTPACGIGGMVYGR